MSPSNYQVFNAHRGEYRGKIKVKETQGGLDKSAEAGKRILEVIGLGEKAVEKRKQRDQKVWGG